MTKSNTVMSLAATPEVEEKQIGKSQTERKKNLHRKGLRQSVEKKANTILVHASHYSIPQCPIGGSEPESTDGAKNRPPSLSETKSSNNKFIRSKTMTFIANSSSHKWGGRTGNRRNLGPVERYDCLSILTDLIEHDDVGRADGRKTPSGFNGTKLEHSSSHTNGRSVKVPWRTSLASKWMM